MGVDGEGRRRAIPETLYGQVVGFAANGNSLVFTSGASIWRVGIDGAELARIADITGLQFGQVALSPDGRFAAFPVWADLTLDVYLMDVQAGDIRRITTGEPWSDDRTAAFSPDGQQIVFASGRDGNSNLYAMNLDGSGLVQLTFGPEHDSLPIWR